MCVHVKQNPIKYRLRNKSVASKDPKISKLKRMTSDSIQSCLIQKKKKNKQTNKKQSALICQVLSPDDVIHFQHFVFTKQQSPLQV